MQLHWHRRDLRVTDNRGLAAGDGRRIGLFVFDPSVLDHAGPPRVAFLLAALDALREEYRSRGSDLLVAVGDPVDLVPAVANAHDCETVTWCADYSGLARRRDTAVREGLSAGDVDFRTVHDAVHHEPGTITTNEGDPYKVFTYFSKKWHDRPKAEPVDPPPASAFAAVESGSDPHTRPALPTLETLDVAEPAADLPAAGPDPARERLEAFCAEDVYRYGNRRDYPSDDCTSRLSTDLKYGTIGIRAVYDATDRAHADAANEAERESVFEFQDQLAWREFYTQVLWDRPDVVTENYVSYERPIEWRDDPDALQAWKDGRTGYPFVDAGMRQLRAEAFVHNRVRMVVASFLTKDLLVDWREGYAWFREKLVDHDTANDTGGWQWAASTGTDAQPYFRIFNPTTQGERYDPDAEYIRRYVPELAGVPAETIHDWPDLDAGTREMHAPEYPAPIVDHGDRREQAVTMFERARGDT